MLTQEDFLAPNMSGEGTLQRSSWKAEAIRRGDLKISGPIPITEDMPLNEDEEREYAEKHRTESSPQPQDAVPPQPQYPPDPPPAPPSVHDETEQQPNHVEAEPQIHEDLHELRHKKSSSGVRETSEMQHRSSVEPAPYSSPSPFPSIPESSSKTSPNKKKRKSGLRNVFRKMFGRRSREEHHEEEGDATHKGHGHTVSVSFLEQNEQNSD